MSDELKYVLEVLPKLSPQDLGEVKARVSFLLGVRTGPDSSSVAETDCDMVLNAIIEEIRSAGGGDTVLVMLRKSQQYSEFRKKVPIALETLRSQPKMTAVRLRAVVRMAISLLYEDLTDMGIAVTARTLMSHIHRLPAVLNKNFPGYLQSGLISLIVRSR